MSEISSNTGDGIKSIRSRFSFTLVINTAKTGITFLAGLLVARGLGPENYGTFAFLTGICITIRNLFDMGTSTAFFTFVSQKTREKEYYSYYFVWLGIQVLLPVLVFGVLLPASWLEMIWLGQPRFLIVLAYFATFFRQQVWDTIVSVGESSRLTHRSQGMTIIY